MMHAQHPTEMLFTSSCAVAVAATTYGLRQYPNLTSLSTLGFSFPTFHRSANRNAIRLGQ